MAAREGIADTVRPALLSFHASPHRSVSEVTLVAKRVRGSRSNHRPGGQGPARTRRTTEALPVTRIDVSTGDPGADIDEAIDMVVMETTEITIDETPVAPPPRRQRRGVKVKPDSLEARVAAENVYVREDLRRIAVVSAALLASLAAAWILFVFLDLLDLY